MKIINYNRYKQHFYNIKIKKNKTIIPFLSYSNQVKKIASKNIRFNNLTQLTCETWLMNHSYYALINGYKRHFLQPNHTDLMRDGTTISDFYVCKILEMDLSAILLKYIQVVENSFRTRLSYLIAKKYSTDDSQYVLESHYTNGIESSKKTVLNKIKDKIKKPNPNSYSHHFFSKNRSIPPWIIMLDIDFYDSIRWYSILRNPERQSIRDQFITRDNNPTENADFYNSFNFLREYRNIFAHSKRNFEEKIDYKLKYEFTNQLKYGYLIPNNSYEKSLLSIIVLTLSFLNDETLEKRFVIELFSLLIEDKYINKDFSKKSMFNDLDIYNILNIPQSSLENLNHKFKIV